MSTDSVKSNQSNEQKMKTILRAQSFDEDLEKELNGVEEAEDTGNNKKEKKKKKKKKEKKKKKKTSSTEEGGAEDCQEDTTGGDGDAGIFENPLDALDALDAMSNETIG